MSRLLRMFPGEKDFREVSQREFDHDFHPHELEKMFGASEDGLVLALDAQIAVYERPGGKILEAKRFPSRSLTRNFGRMVRMLFSNVNENLVDLNAAAYQSKMTQNNIGASALCADPNQQELTGACMAIGNGVADEDSGRIAMVSQVQIQNARLAVYTTLEDATAITFAVNEGLTVQAQAGVNVSEIGLFAQLSEINGNPAVPPRRTMIAYDGVGSTPVAQGGVVAPKYTLTFAA